MVKEHRGEVLHGVLLIVLFSCSAFYIAEFEFVKRLSFSPLIVGIILGMLYANSLRNKLPETWVPGIKLCSKQILRMGIVLYGFRLTFQQVVAIGLPAIAADCLIVAGTIGLGLLLGRLLGIDRDTTLMTSTGSAICGAAAVLGCSSTPCSTARTFSGSTTCNGPSTRVRHCTKWPTSWVPATLWTPPEDMWPTQPPSRR